MISGLAKAENSKVSEGTGTSSSGVTSNQGVREYLLSSGKQLVLGNYTDDVTLLGTGAQIATGLVGVDLPGDVRDISADIVNWNWSLGHIEQTTLDVAALLPIVGAIKYGDEVATLIKGTSKTIKWSSKSVSDAAKLLENGATSVTVKTRAEAEELFLGKYQGAGYKNVTGMDAMDSKNLLGTKANTYHWDDSIGADGRVIGHSPTSSDGAMPHLQIHPENGSVIRIFFEE